MKVTLISLALCVALATGEAPSGPYPASGWRPSGALLVLPSRQQAQQEYGPPPQEYGPPPSQEYGPPANATELPQETTEAPQETNSALEQLKKQEGSNSGTYYVVLPDGRLHKIEYSTAPLKKAEEPKKVEEPKPAPPAQAPKVKQEVYHLAFDEEQQKFAAQFSRPLEHLNAPASFGQEPQQFNQQPQQYNQQPQQYQPQQFNQQPQQYNQQPQQYNQQPQQYNQQPQQYQPQQFNQQPQQYNQQPQQFNQQPQQFQQQTKQYNEQPQESNSFTTRQLYPQYIPEAAPQPQQQKEFRAPPQQQFTKQFNGQEQSSYLPPQATNQVRFPDQPAPAAQEDSKPEVTKEKVAYVANIQYTDVEPIKGPVYSYDSAPLVRIIRK